MFFLTTAIKITRIWHHKRLQFLRLLKLWCSKTTSTKPVDLSKTWSRTRLIHAHVLDFRSGPSDLSEISLLARDWIQASKSWLFLPFHFVPYISLTSGIWIKFGNSSNVILCILTQSKASLQFVLSCFPLSFAEFLVFYLFPRSSKFSLAFTRTIYFPCRVFLLRIQTFVVCTGTKSNFPIALRVQETPLCKESPTFKKSELWYDLGGLLAVYLLCASEPLYLSLLCGLTLSLTKFHWQETIFQHFSQVQLKSMDYFSASQLAWTVF